MFASLKKLHFNDPTVPDVSYEYFTPSNDTDNEHQIWYASGAVEYDKKDRQIKTTLQMVLFRKQTAVET